MEYLQLREILEEYEAVYNEHDKGYKYLFSAKRVFLELLNTFIKKDWIKYISEEDTGKIEKTFIAPDFKNKEADLLYRSKIKDKEYYFYVLLELQSKVDFQMPFRLLVYRQIALFH